MTTTHTPPTPADDARSDGAWDAEHLAGPSHWNGSRFCGCHMTKGIGKSGQAVQFCPMHFAAPELLTALEAIINASDGCVGHRNCNHGMEPWTLARAAIRTATGEEAGR